MTTDEGRSTDRPTRHALLERGIRRLEAADRTAPRRTVEWLLTEILGCDRGHLYAHSQRPVETEVADRFEAWVERRAAGEPLQHILGYASFRGLRIEVSTDVMVPRPETEEVVELALRNIDTIESPRVLDVGTGSGCIALAIKRERPDAEVFGCDVSEKALAVAQKNARHLDLDVSFRAADVFADDFSERVPADLDLLISNPPYIPDDEAETLPPVVREYDPPVALFSGDDPLRFYRVLARWGHALCLPGGGAVFEAHADYVEETATVLREAGFADVRVDEDLSGRPRIVRGTVPDPQAE